MNSKPVTPSRLYNPSCTSPSRRVFSTPNTSADSDGTSNTQSGFAARNCSHRAMSHRSSTGRPSLTDAAADDGAPLSEPLRTEWLEDAMVPDLADGAARDAVEDASSAGGSYCSSCGVYMSSDPIAMLMSSPNSGRSAHNRDESPGKSLPVRRAA